MRKSPKALIQDAAEAHSNLTTLAAVVEILEGGCIYGPNKAAEEIIRIAKREQRVQLRKYDKARAAALQEADNG